MKRYGPHIAARKTHQRLWKFSFVTKKRRLLQQYRRLAQSGHSAESSAASTLLVSPWREGAPRF